MKSNFKGEQYSSKQRKIYKLKRENVRLGQQHRQVEWYIATKNTCPANELLLFKTLYDLAFKIGKNSAKIQRLRTQIHQEKKLNEHSSGA